MITFLQIIRDLIVVFGLYFAACCLITGSKIAKMSKEDYKRLQKASRSKEGWKPHMTDLF